MKEHRRGRAKRKKDANDGNERIRHKHRIKAGEQKSKNKYIEKKEKRKEEKQAGKMEERATKKTGEETKS